jgi:hypothetical protein
VPTYSTPGVYLEEVVAARPPALRTGVPAFVGMAAAGPVLEPVELSRWSGFEAAFGPAAGQPEGGFLAHAVRGFFQNGGELCHVVRLEDPDDPEMRAVLRDASAAGADLALAALTRALATLEPLDEVDLVCAPDVMRAVARLSPPGRAATGSDEASAAADAAVRMQGEVLAHCRRTGDRFAILDALPGSRAPQAAAQAAALESADGALYLPWLRTAGDAALPGAVVPPCGHVAGIFARTDAAAGVHKSPANEALEGVLDVETVVGEAGHAAFPATVNVIRPFPRRGIRVWGARTLGGGEWTYVGVRRLFLTLRRWVARALANVTFEPVGLATWAHVERELTRYMTGLYESGALAGATPAEAFYVRCDAATNPPEVQALGHVVAEVGMAAAAPNEFVVVRVTHGAGGTTTRGPGPA